MVVVTGFHAADVESALSGLPVTIVRNPEYQQGQGTSIRAGVQAVTLVTLDTSPFSKKMGGRVRLVLPFSFWQTSRKSLWK